MIDDLIIIRWLKYHLTNTGKNPQQGDQKSEPLLASHEQTKTAIRELKTNQNQETATLVWIKSQRVYVLYAPY